MIDFSKVPFGTKFKVTGCKEPAYVGRIVEYTNTSKFCNIPHFLWPSYGLDIYDGWDGLQAVLRAEENKQLDIWWVELEPLKKVKRKVV